MKKCIFCMKNKQDDEFNKEHIILDSLGGKGIDNFVYNVCKKCNSMLGSKVDSWFANDEVTKAYRYMLKIKGRNNIQNPFKEYHFQYDDTPITGVILTNRQGDIIGFKADCKTYQLDDKVLIVAPRKNFCGFVNNYLKKNGFPLLTEKEILENKLKIDNPKYPTIQTIEIDESYRDIYLKNACPLLWKMAYEFCFIRLGDQYLDDKVAKDIRGCLNEIIKGNLEIQVPTDIKVEYTNLEQKTSISFEYDKANDKLYVCIIIFGIIKAKILMTETFHKYVLDNEKSIEFKY